MLKDQFDEMAEEELYEVVYPGEWEDDFQKEQFNLMISNCVKLIKGEFTEKLELPVLHDPVYDEGKKEEKKGKDAKKGVVQEEEPVKEEVFDYSHLL